MSYRFKYGDRPLDDYTIQRAVGSGGFGEVYYAVSDGGREVALKYLRQNPESELRGVSHCINLKSPHLVSIFDVKKNADGDYFIIMEYCSGPSLRDLLIAEPNGFPQEKAAFFIREIAKGLAYLHDRGIVHRDLKPGNIFYDDAYVKIGDYGLSKFISVSRHSAQTASVGTVHYMAPEIGSGNYSRGVDIYALGVMLYEMLLGKVPFEGSSMAEILMKHLTSQPEVDELPKPFTKIIRRALEKDPDDRYQNVNEMVDDLLSVEQVQSSLDGFSPQSLDGAVGQAVHADSPIPSPNPPPRPKAVDAAAAIPFNLDLRDVERLPGRVSKRLDKINKRFGKRMARLARDVPQRSQTVGDQRAGKITDNEPRPPSKSRVKRMIPALLLTLGLAVGTGLLVGANVREEVGLGAAMLIIAMSLGSGLAKKVQRWFGDEDLPGWVVTLMSGVVCAPLLFLAGAPLCDYTSLYVGAVGGLVVSLLFANWDRVREIGAEGSLGLGGALWVGFGAGMAGAIIGAIVDEGRYADMAFLTTGAIAAVSVIVVQANCWWLVGSAGPRSPRSGRGTRLNFGVFDEAALGEDDQEGAQAPFSQGGADDDLPPFAVPVDNSNGRQVRARARAAARYDRNMRDRTERSTATRIFWSFIAFVLMGGAIVGFVSAIVDSSMTDPFPEIVATCGCAAFVIFALSKTTMRRRPGFWRDTLRPFLISLMLFAIGATITGIATGATLETTITTMSEFPGGDTVLAESLVWRRRVPLAACISGLAISSVGLIVVLAIRGRRKRQPATQQYGKGAARIDDEPNDEPGVPQSEQAVRHG